MIHRLLAVALCAMLGAAGAYAAEDSFTLEEIMSYPFPGELVAAEDDPVFAWVLNERGVRNIWVAAGPEFEPRRITNYATDDGQQLTQLRFSPDGRYLVYVRGGDDHANWPAEGNLAPNPTSGTEEPKVTIWAVELDGGEPVRVAVGSEPAVSDDNVVAFIRDHQVWTASIDGEGEQERLFFDRGEARGLHWSPDGEQIAFVSDRGDHSLIGVFTSQDEPLAWLAPSTHRDRSPRWSPDGEQIAFVRLRGRGGPPEPILERTPEPWSIQVADVASGDAHTVWASPDTLRGSFPGDPVLDWAAGDRLVFLADLDGWPHLYSVPAAGEAPPLLLTPGEFMVEHVELGPDRRFLVYSANTGTARDDGERRHVFSVPVDAAKPIPITAGESLQWEPVIGGDGGHVAYIGATAQQPPFVYVAESDGEAVHALTADRLPDAFPAGELVVPVDVTFEASDGVTVHGQLFQRDGGAAEKPGIIFLHGGPPRQMLLGWHYSGYYSNSYAVNQYLANHGFVVLSVNYRLGIGYGHAFNNPPHWGPTGASEYLDVVAGGRFLQTVDGVDPERIGLWGGSYGGYLTALGLARSPELFRAGVDLHGVHDWSVLLGTWFGDPGSRYEQGDFEEAIEVAWESSPNADIADWRSPVLLIHGDDDRNVRFHQTVDLVRRLREHDVPFELLVLPNEIHGFLRYASWLKANTATVAFFREQFLERGRD
ncbi:MAG TPA: prolyl oligopeptidase family serine peptidase [Woeseiaceae bacterium]|nr:prolyl oligopeptidase family serine peptidase [Woeseiaceae bacterium]